MLFRSEENEVQRQESLDSIGVELEVLPVNREVSSYWISLSLNSGQESRDVLKSAATSFAPRAGVQVTPCRQQQIALSAE